MARTNWLLRTRVLLLAIFLSATTAHGVAAALSRTSDVALTVSPVRAEVTADPGTSVVVTATLTNDGTAVQAIRTETQDFVASDESGKPQLVGGATDTWSMSSWVSIRPSAFTLAPGQTETITVSIDVPEAADPGGHYSAALFGTTPATGQTSVSARVGLLLLLRVNGEIVEAGTASLSGPRFAEPSGVLFKVRFHNTGNVHVKPTGVVSVRDLRGASVARIEVPEENVLPDSSRALSVRWDSPPIGVYRARAELTYGTSESRVTSGEFLFVVAPWRSILGGLALFAAGAFLAWLTGRRRRTHRPDIPADANDAERHGSISVEDAE